MLEQKCKTNSPEVDPYFRQFTEEEKTLLESLNFIPNRCLGCHSLLYQEHQIGDTRLKVVIKIEKNRNGVRVWRKIVLYWSQDIPINLFEQKTGWQVFDTVQDTLDWLGFDTSRAS